MCSCNATLDVLYLFDLGGGGLRVTDVRTCRLTPLIVQRQYNMFELNCLLKQCQRSISVL